MLEATPLLILVSIQLISPASGESVQTMDVESVPVGFHSINFPSEWGVDSTLPAGCGDLLFPFN